MPSASGGVFSVSPTMFPGTSGLLVGNHLNQVAIAVTATAPAAVAAQMGLTDSFRISTDVRQVSPNTWQQDIGITATLAPGGVSAPASVNLGNVALKTSAVQVVTISNCGNALPIDSITITGANASEFATVGTLPAALPGAGGAPIQVQLSPHAPGAKTAALVVAYGGGAGTVTIDLTGTTDGVDRQTYYACTTGGPIGLAPLVLALAFALRRRRR